MTTLFDIDRDLRNLEEAIEEMEPDQQDAALLKWFADLESDLTEQRDRKIDNYCSLISELKAKESARKLEADRLVALGKVDGNKAERLKNKLLEYLNSKGINKLETAKHKLSVSKSGGKPPLILDDNYPIALMPEDVLDRVPNKSLIRALIEAGANFDFARLGDRGTSLRIR